MIIVIVVVVCRENPKFSLKKMKKQMRNEKIKEITYKEKLK